MLVQGGMEPVMQMTTHDRNRIAIQADILGATVRHQELSLDRRGSSVLAATAILDRYLHHAEVIAITRRSYRLKDQAVKKETCSAEKETVRGPRVNHC